MACTLAGSSTVAKPLSSAVKAMPFFAAWRLAHSCPLMHNLALYGKYEQNLMNNGPKSSSKQ